MQFIACCQRQQPFIWWSAPEEGGKPHGKFPLCERSRGMLRSRLEEIEKAGRGKNDAQRRANGHGKRLPCCQFPLEDVDELVDEARLGLHVAKGNPGKLGECVTAAFGSRPGWQAVWHLQVHDLLERRRAGFWQRALQFDPVDPDRRLIPIPSRLFFPVKNMLEKLLEVSGLPFLK